MSTSTHPPDRRAKLRRAGLSEGTEMTEEIAERLDAAADDTSPVKLRDIVQGRTGKPKVERPTIAGEAVRTLREQGPMHYRDLADLLLEEGKVRPRGKTFKQTLSAALGRHPEVERVAPGVFKAKEEG